MTKTDNQTQTMAKADIEAVRERLAHVSYLWRRIGEDQRADDMDAILAAQAAHAAQRDALRDALEAITGTTDWFYTVSMPRALRDKAEEALSALPERWERVSPDGWVLVPRDPSYKLIADLASEWCYTIEEASESYQGFLDVVARHGMAGSDPSAYEDAPSAPEVPVKGEESPFAPMGGEQVSEGAQQ